MIGAETNDDGQIRNIAAAGATGPGTSGDKVAINIGHCSDLDSSKQLSLSYYLTINNIAAAS